MKNVAIASMALVLFAATAAAGDLAVSKSTLSSMGLQTMQQMTDSDGLAVRGKGTFAGVWGGSQATWAITIPGSGSGHWNSTPDQTILIGASENNYEAGASWLGKSSAAGGSSLSFAGTVEVLFAADPTGFALQAHVAAGIAGGGASAFAN
jgi:hypothetical protein